MKTMIITIALAALLGVATRAANADITPAPVQKTWAGNSAR